MTVQAAARVEPNIKEAASKVAVEFGLDVSLNGDEFNNDTEYFKQIPGYWDNTVEASEEPLEGLVSAKEAGWNV
jgi:hypothetical protein